MAVRGCGSGIVGKNDRGLDLYGLLAFIQLQQCSHDLCNAKLNLTTRALIPVGRWERSPSPWGGAAWGLSRSPAGPGETQKGCEPGHAPGRGQVQWAGLHCWRHL